jgi:hypothetical protein
MNPATFGKRRAVSLDYRIVCITTGRVIIIYPGQMADFCREFDLNYNSIMSYRSKYPHKAVPMYSWNTKAKQFIENDFYLLPADTAQIRP